jgi:hypothetical protein
MGTKNKATRRKSRKESDNNPSCRHCRHPSLEWREQAPNGMHRYAVYCPRCEEYYKWGSAQELQSLRESDNAPVVVPYQPPRNLDEFIE